MGMAHVSAGAVSADERWMYRVGGIAALVLGIAYIVTIVLYASVGAPPLGGDTWLAYAAGKTSAWWAIVGLAVLTDLLFVPVAFSLFLLLRSINRGAMLLATAFVLLFVVLDVAVTQATFAALIALSGSYDDASTVAQQAAIVAAATYATAVLTSTIGLYSIVLLALGQLIIGIVMVGAGFSRGAALLALAAGGLGVVSVVGPTLVGALSSAVILGSLLTTAWVLLVGYRLIGLARRGTTGDR